MVVICREHDISDATYYIRKAKYGGIEVSDIKPLKELEEESQQIKHIFADLILKHEVFKGIVERKL